MLAASVSTSNARAFVFPYCLVLLLRIYAGFCQLPPLLFVMRSLYKNEKMNESQGVLYDEGRQTWLGEELPQGLQLTFAQCCFLDLVCCSRWLYVKRSNRRARKVDPEIPANSST